MHKYNIFIGLNMSSFDIQNLKTKLALIEEADTIDYVMQLLESEQLLDESNLINAFGKDKAGLALAKYLHSHYRVNNTAELKPYTHATGNLSLTDFKTNYDNFYIFICKGGWAAVKPERESIDRKFKAAAEKNRREIGAPEKDVVLVKDTSYTNYVGIFAERILDDSIDMNDPQALANAPIKDVVVRKIFTKRGGTLTHDRQLADKLADKKTGVDYTDDELQKLADERIPVGSMAAWVRKYMGKIVATNLLMHETSTAGASHEYMGKNRNTTVNPASVERNKINARAANKLDQSEEQFNAAAQKSIEAIINKKITAIDVAGGDTDKLYELLDYLSPGSAESEQIINSARDDVDLPKPVIDQYRQQDERLRQNASQHEKEKENVLKLGDAEVVDLMVKRRVPVAYKQFLQNLMQRLKNFGV